MACDCEWCLRERVEALTQALREADFLLGGMATADTLTEQEMLLVNAWREAAHKLVEEK